MAIDPVAQMQAEAEELASLPQTPLTQFMVNQAANAGRCFSCGAFCQSLIPCHDMSPDGKTILNQRYKGVDCGCGLRHL